MAIRSKFRKLKSKNASDMSVSLTIVLLKMHVWRFIVEFWKSFMHWMKILQVFSISVRDSYIAVVY